MTATYWQKQLELAERIAREAHEGQTRRDGTPYIAHPERVVRFLKDNMEVRGVQCVGWLHDVTEDTEWTMVDLMNAGVDWDVLTAVRLVDKKQTVDKGENYMAYIHDLSKNKWARAVKLADILDNMTDDPTDKQKGKYRKALFHLAK